MRTRAPWFLGIAILVGACGGGVSEDELATSNARIESLTAQLAEAGEALEDRAESITNLRAGTTALESEVEDSEEASEDARGREAQLQQQLDAAIEDAEKTTAEFALIRGRLEARIGNKEADIKRLESELERAIQRATELELLYSEEIRSEVAGAIDIEVTRACEEAITKFTTPIDRIVNIEDDWASIVSKEEVIDRVAECADPARAEILANRALAVFAEEEFRGGEWVQTSGQGGDNIAEGERYCGALRSGDVVAALASRGRPESVFEPAARELLCPDISFTIVSGGIHIVGNGPDDIAPGRYRSAPEVDSCYWERTASNGDIIDNDFVTFAAGGVVVNVASSDASVEFGCGLMVRFG